MPLPEHTHPVWKVLSNLSIAAVALVLTASNFDAGEWTTLAALLGGNALTEKVFKS